MQHKWRYFTPKQEVKVESIQKYDYFKSALYWQILLKYVT